MSKPKLSPIEPASRLVYSTDHGRSCPQCRQAASACRCKKGAALFPVTGPVMSPAVSPGGDSIVRVSRQTKGRGGKSVTLVHGLTLTADALAALGKSLRTACGAGGTVKDGVIEVQGDHCARVMDELQHSGFKVKRAGG